jgi:hypothetical protein
MHTQKAGFKPQRLLRMQRKLCKFLAYLRDLRVLGGGFLLPESSIQNRASLRTEQWNIYTTNASV